MQRPPIIILVAPQMGENIGAAARAMKNFDISSLRIVSPRDGWPNEQARSVAVGAVDIIDRAEIYDNLGDAVKDVHHLYASTSTQRRMNKHYISPKDLQNEYPAEGVVGIMFGRENSGLNNQEISMANKIITINTGPFSSLNIAQSVAIICYELFASNTSSNKVNNIQDNATRGEINYFFDHLFAELEGKNFFKVQEKKEMMMRNIINIFTRIDNASKSEIQTLRGIISSLTKK